MTPLIWRIKAKGLIRHTEEQLFMNSLSPALQDKKVGVIGFNARPIALSLKHAGAETYVSDYWGDLDLKKASDSCIAVLSPTPGIRQRQPLYKPLPELLLDNFFELTKNIELDHIIVGSGFDDNSDLLIPLEKTGKLLGCSTKQIKNARDRNEISNAIKSLDVQLPTQFTAFSFDELKPDTLTFPLVCRKLVSGGGRGLRLARNYEELHYYMKKSTSEEEIHRPVIQQYVEGTDISCSVLGTGSKSVVLSTQNQLIGMPTAGRNNDFVYCGNYCPSSISSQIRGKIEHISQVLCNKLELRGSIGIDYIVDDEEKIWLMEINPRIQGTLEMLELASNVSIMTLHVQATFGDLPRETINFQPVVKMIVYSRKSGILDDLPHFTNIVDKSPPGIYLEQGDPICTVLQTGQDIKQCYSHISNIALQIQREIRSIEDRRK